MLSASSSHAFGRVEYFQNITDKNLVIVSLIIGKSRNAPSKKKTSIVKLELQAVITAVRIKDKLIEGTKLNVNPIFFSTDSKTVLKDKKQQKTLSSLGDTPNN